MTNYHRPRRNAAVAALAGVLILAACGGSNDDPKTTSTDKTTDTDAAGSAGSTAEGGIDSGDTLRIFTAVQPGNDAETNSYTTEMEQQLGVDMSFEATTWDAGTSKEKRQVVLASGEYPDAFFLVPWVDAFSQAEILKLADQDVVIPLNDLIAQNAPNVAAYLEKYPALKAMATAPDGNIYGLPQWNDCFHCTHAAKMWINQAWLDKLGLEMPTTTDELTAVLEAFKNDDPNGNGQADEIPLTSFADDSAGPLSYLLQAFAHDPGKSTPKLVLDGDQVVYAPTSDAWREGLKYINGLSAAGLIDPGALTQKGDALIALGDFADAELMGAVVAMHPAMFQTLGQDDGRDRNFVAVPPLAGPDGTQYASYQMPTSPNPTFAITSAASASDQIAAIKLLDSMFPVEGQLRAQFGIKGVTWGDPEAGDIALDPSIDPVWKVITPEEGSPEAEKALNSSWGPAAQYASDYTFRASEVANPDPLSPAGLEARLFAATLLYQPFDDQASVFPRWEIWLPEGQLVEEAELETNIESAAVAATVGFMTGVMDPNDDAAWASYVDSLEGLGLDRYLEIWTEAYTALGK